MIKNLHFYHISASKLPQDIVFLHFISHKNIYILNHICGKRYLIIPRPFLIKNGIEIWAYFRQFVRFRDLIYSGTYLDVYYMWHKKRKPALIFSGLKRESLLLTVSPLQLRPRTVGARVVLGNALDNDDDIRTTCKEDFSTRA